MPPPHESGEAAFGPNDTLGKWCDGQPSLSQDMSSGNRSKVLSLQAYFKRAGNYTVLFSLAPATDPPPEIIEAEATIEWSSGGNTITRRISVFNGTAITGVAESVTVKVRDVSSTGGGGDYLVTASVAPGIRGEDSLPPVLIPHLFDLALNPGGQPSNPVTIPFPTVATSYLWNIPQNVGIKAVMIAVSNSATIGTPAPIPEQAVQVQHLGPGIVPILKSYDPRAFQWVPIALGATSIRVNSGVTATISTRFHISFAVEG